MKYLWSKIFLLALLVAPAAVAQSSLPQCPVLSVAKVPWTDCQGIITFSDGSKYVGGFSDGKMTGQGTMFYADGTKYVGEFLDGKMNGQGAFTWANGTKYVGEFRDGKMNGPGTLTWADGRKSSGIWDNGKFIETGRDALAPK
jgi:hypothetical protein